MECPAFFEGHSTEARFAGQARDPRWSCGGLSGHHPSCVVQGRLLVANVETIKVKMRLSAFLGLRPRYCAAGHLTPSACRSLAILLAEVENEFEAGAE